MDCYEYDEYDGLISHACIRNGQVTKSALRLMNIFYINLNLTSNTYNTTNKVNVYKALRCDE